VKIAETQTSSDDVLQNLEDIVLTPELAAAITEQEQASLLKTDFVEVFEVPETTLTIQSSYTVSSLVNRRFYTFLHNRQFGPGNVPSTIALGELAAVPLTQPLFYVATGVYFDSELQTEIESPFSIEIVGQPVVIQTNVGTFPATSRLQIVQDTISSLNRTTPQLGVAPGNVIRDTVVDPVSNEVVRVRFLVDYLYRTQSFDTLLQVDGIEPDGTSTPVSLSPYKQALQRVLDIQNAQDVQILIDTSFDQNASRNNVFRKTGTRSRGFVTFFTRQQPQATVFIPLGTRVASGGVQFVTTSDASFSISDLASFFNPSTGLFQLDVPIQAVNLGKIGNLGAGQIRTIISNLPGLSVTNRNNTFGGIDRQTNLALSIDARAALASVDTGTEQGIRQVAADVAGVEEANVVAAGDPDMQRDFDEDFDKHVGGKVDVWVRGDVPGTVTDNFAFTFQIAQDVQFRTVGNLLQYVFQALDVNLSTSNPISEMLDDPSLGLGLRNATQGSFYNLDGVQIQDSDTIELDPTGQLTTRAADVILGDYQYQETTDFVFTRQPVGEVQSVTGEVSGLLPTDNWEVVRPSDPSLEGRSVRAQDFLRILPSDGIPSGSPISVQSESHIMLGQFPEFVNSLGANPLTIRVFNDSRTIEYRGPSDPSGSSDFTITPGTQTTALSVQRTVNSNILSGQTVLVDYDHAENFTVEYTTNFVIQTVQQVLDQQKAATSDVLAKAALPVPVDITATIATIAGQTTSFVDRNVRTNLISFIRSIPQGGSIRQSDIIAIIDSTQGVSFVETPLTKLARGAGSEVVRESVTTADGEDVTWLMGTTKFPMSTATVRTWLVEDELNSATSDGGGPDTNFRGVFQDDREMALVTSSVFALPGAAGQAFIIGLEGADIPGFSDDQTIQNQFPTAVTNAQVEEIRKQLTANRLLVTTAADDTPVNHEYTVTYVVAFEETRVKDLEADELEFFDVGAFTFTFAEDPRG
jgi:hypothetical protein